MSEIKVGEYIRTKLGIAKIEKIVKYDDDSKDYYVNRCIDDEDKTNILHRHQILKHSKNIIDLIKVRRLYKRIHSNYSKL